MRTARVGWFPWFVSVLVSGQAFAQTPPASAPAPAPAPAAGAPAGTAAAPADSAAAPAPTATPRPATGYAPSAHRAERVVKGGKGKGTRNASVARKSQTGGFVIEPGFEATEGGGSRVFVELGQAVPVDERKAKGTLTFVLRGAHNAFRNNFNPLVTEHFNTPVRRAKLAPAGHDLLLVIELRQDVTPTHRFITNADGHAVLQVDFPGGTFIKEPARAIPEPTSDESGDQQNAPAEENAPAKPPPAKKTRGKGPQP
jgi:hypothetical protein